MLEFSQLLFFFLFVLQKQLVRGQGSWLPPVQPNWPLWAEDLINSKLTRMNEELMRDMTRKRNHIQNLHLRYKDRESYEIGLIAADMLEIFKHMLRLYTKYASVPAFIYRWSNNADTLNGFHVMQGDYNQLLVQKDVFLGIIEKHRKRREEEIYNENNLRTKDKVSPGRAGKHGASEAQVHKEPLWQAKKHKKSTKRDPNWFDEDDKKQKKLQ